MKTPFRPQTALAILAVSALLWTLGCSKEEPAPAAPPQAKVNPPTAPAAPKPARPESAVPNSFYEVMDRLDQGGQVYGYLSSEQWFDGLADRLDGFKTTLLENIPTKPEDRAQIDKGVNAALGFIRKSGLEEISGVGLSGFAVEKDLHRSKFIVHHYPDHGEGFVWSLFGKAPGKMEGLHLLPANTVIASSSQFDLPGLWAVAEEQVKASGYPQAAEQLVQAKGMFAMATGVEFDALLASLGGEYGVALTLDEAQPVQIPGSKPVEISRPDLLIFMKVNDTTIYDRFISFAKSEQMPILEDEKDGVKSASMPVPVPIGAEYKLTLASADGLLLLGSSPAVVREALDVRAGAKSGLTATPAFARLAAGIPTEGNSFTYVSESFGKVYLDIQLQTMELAPTAEEVPVPLIRKMMEKFSQPAASYGVFQNTGEGWLWTGNSTTSGATQVAAAAVVAPVGVLAAIAIPNFVKARKTAQKNTCIANLKQIDGAKQQWAIDNRKNGTAIPTDADLFGSTLYLKRKPQCPLSGQYSINRVDQDPTCSHGVTEGHSLGRRVGR